MFASKVPPVDTPWTPPIVPMPLRPRSESPQPHCRPAANTCCSTTGGDYRIVVWREGRTRQHCRATVGVFQMRSGLPCRFSPDILTRKKEKEKSEPKAREQEVYVRRFCSESVRRSGAGCPNVYFRRRANGSHPVRYRASTFPRQRFVSDLISAVRAPFPRWFHCRYPIRLSTMSYIRIGLSFQLRRHMRDSVIACVRRAGCMSSPGLIS